MTDSSDSSSSDGNANANTTAQNTRIKSEKKRSSRLVIKPLTVFSDKEFQQTARNAIKKHLQDLVKEKDDERLKARVLDIVKEKLKKRKMRVHYAELKKQFTEFKNEINGYAYLGSQILHFYNKLTRQDHTKKTHGGGSPFRHIFINVQPGLKNKNNTTTATTTTTTATNDTFSTPLVPIPTLASLPLPMAPKLPPSPPLTFMPPIIKPIQNSSSLMSTPPPTLPPAKTFMPIVAPIRNSPTLITTPPPTLTPSPSASPSPSPSPLGLLPPLISPRQGTPSPPFQLTNQPQQQQQQQKTNDDDDDDETQTRTLPPLSSWCPWPPFR